MIRSLSLMVLATLLTCSSAFAQLPVWPIVTGFPQSGPTQDLVSTTPHQFIDWTVGIPSAVNIPNTASNRIGPAQAGINGCDELEFFTLHNGVITNATAALQIFTPTGLYLPLTGGDMNASAGDDEIQIVRRPGFPNQWFVIYNLAPTAFPASNPGYQSCFLAYSLIEVNSTSASYVLDGANNPIQDRIIDVSGTNYQYFNGKATSRTSVVVGGDHDIYAQRRTQAFGSGNISITFFIDRFTISNSDAIIWTGSSSQVQGYSWSLMAAGSPIELSPAENSLAVMARAEADDQQEIYLFDPASLAAAPNTIIISELQIEFTAAPLPLVGLFHQAEEFDATVGNTFDWLRNFERKISGLEYSPNGDYLYISGGGFVNAFNQNLTYLGQIDLTQTIGGDHPVRLQVEQANSANTFNATSGAGNLWTNGNLTNYWDYHGLTSLQSCFDGNLYFSKANSTNLFVLPNPNALMPINMAPSSIDFSTGLVPNMPANGFVSIMPDQIDGFDYSISNFTSVSFNVSNQNLCKCEPVQIAVVNANTLDTFTVLNITECPTVVTLCLEEGESYNLLGDNGINFINAIISGNHIYPVGTNMFNFGNGGAVGTTFTTVTNALITSDEVWDGKYFIPDFMIVTVDNATLDLTNVDVVFGECAGIDFINGAQLRANNSVLRPCDIDGTWRGLDFYVTDANLPVPTGIINECTFKNAQRAIHGFEMSQFDVRVTNNLFSNCKAGVAIQDGRYLRSISGNTFLLDDLAPKFDDLKCSWSGDQNFMGITSRNVSYFESITQNDFIAPDFTTEKFVGVLSTGDRSISVNSNNFTNVYQSVFLQEDRNGKVESNEIQVTNSFTGFEHQITALHCTATLIGNNTIVNSSQYQITEWAGNNSAIYCNGGTSYDIKENKIDGFETGIQVENLRNVHIIDNEIGNCFFYGIYENSVLDTKTSCNTINMEVQEGVKSIGIGYFTPFDSPFDNEISSNCISESNIAIYLEGVQITSTMPMILNNYLYNYSDYGVDAINMTGDIGSSPSPASGAGRNSFISNNGLGLAADIASTNPMTSFGNFGVSFVSGNISIAGNSINSTASCGHQIDLANSSNGYVEICDDLAKSIAEFIFNGNGLSNDFSTAIHKADYAELVHVLHVVKNSSNPFDIDLFYQEVMMSGTISENEKQWFAFNFNILVDDKIEAANILNSIVPKNQDETDLVTIQRTQLDAVDSLSAVQISELEAIASTDSPYSHLAISLLVNDGVLLDRVFYATRIPAQVNANTTIISVESTSFSVYPNPTNGEVSFIYSLDENTNADLEVFDIAGNRVALVPLEYQHSLQTMDLSSLSHGIYTLFIVSEEGILAQSKLVKF